jgi:trehalose synthase
MTTPTLDHYAEIVGEERVGVITRLARRLEGLRIVAVNSTRVGGGVAEILAQEMPLLGELGIRARWEVMEGPPEFYQATKRIHNALQGQAVEFPARLQQAYLAANRSNAERLDLGNADVVIIHDPQPAALIDWAPRTCPWVWRCHIDASRPDRATWMFLRQFIAKYDASIFSLASFAKRLSHPQYLIAPAIDPLGEKNCQLEDAEIAQTLARFGLDRSRPLIVQVSRFDRFKDPVGVIKAFRMARRHHDARLVLAGGAADDDPEGAQVLQQVLEAAGDDPDIVVLNLPPDSHRAINALQRAATVIVQKSTKEGFGLTVAEGLWKGRPVIGGAVGGITLQVIDYQTGFLVHSVEGLAFRLGYLLNRPDMIESAGRRGREHVRHHFLLTRHLRDWLTLLLFVSESREKGGYAG